MKEASSVPTRTPLSCDKCNTILVVPYHPGGPLFEGIRFCTRHAELLRLGEEMAIRLDRLHKLAHTVSRTDNVEHCPFINCEFQDLLNRYKVAMES
jgi:hypothetical protein